VQAVPGPIGYRPRQNAERCEGFYQQQVAGSLELLSLVAGPINYDLVTDKILTVSVPPLPMLQGSQIFITARSLSPASYRMDAVMAPSSKFKWPLSDVLAPANMRSDSIGVTAWINQPLGRYYVPVSVVPENIAPSAARPPLMIFRSSLDIVVLKWRVRPEGAGTAPDYVNFGGDSPAIIRAGQPIPIEIRNKPSGPTIVDIAAHFRSLARPEAQQLKVILP
jgi:hypothetical protein